jgi:hypothetical protein
MQDFEASDGEATINAHTTITATRIGSPRLQSAKNTASPNIDHQPNSKTRRLQIIPDSKGQYMCPINPVRGAGRRMSPQLLPKSLTDLATIGRDKMAGS